MLNQLRLKFILVIMVCVTLMQCAIFGMVTFSTAKNLQRECIRNMERIASHPGSRPDIKEGNLNYPYYAVYLDPRGSYISDDGTFTMEEAQLQELLADILAKPERGGEIKELNLRYLRSSNPRGYAVVFTLVAGEQQTVLNLIKTCFFIGIVCTVLFFFISLQLSRWVVKPVAQAFEEQKQFISDASHELKTPLTVIMTNAELLQSRCIGDAQAQQFSGSILTMTQQMRSLVENLLELARVDKGSVEISFAPVDMSRLAEMSLLPFEPVYFERGLTLAGQIAPNILLNGSESHLQHLVDILLDNAAKYAHPQTQVQLTLQRQGKNCHLSVCNVGEPIDKEDLKNIFKRFYRIDKARSRNGSYGLGLSIAQSIVNAHGGKIWAESSGGLNTFHILLPL